MANVMNFNGRKHFQQRARERESFNIPHVNRFVAFNKFLLKSAANTSYAFRKINAIQSNNGMGMSYKYIAILIWHTLWNDGKKSESHDFIYKVSFGEPSALKCSKHFIFVNFHTYIREMKW